MLYYVFKFWKLQVKGNLLVDQHLVKPCMWYKFSMFLKNIRWHIWPHRVLFSDVRKDENNKISLKANMSMMKTQVGCVFSLSTLNITLACDLMQSIALLTITHTKLIGEELKFTCLIGEYKSLGEFSFCELKNHRVLPLSSTGVLHWLCSYYCTILLFSLQIKITED